MKRSIFAVLMISWMSAVSLGALVDNQDASILVKMFSWWNETMNGPNAFTEEGFRKYYTEDAVIFINRRVTVRGIKPLVSHFNKIQEATDWVEIILPFEVEFLSASGDRIFTYHLIQASADGEKRTTHVMGYAQIEQGKISVVDFLRIDAPFGAK